MLNSIIDVVTPHLLAGSVMAAIMVIMLAVHWLRGTKHKAKDAMEILRQRYARGEIDRDEYEERRHTLNGDMLPKI